MVDRDDDLRVGIKSTAVLLGDLDPDDDWPAQSLMFELSGIGV